MSIFTWSNSCVKNLDWKDIASVKLSVAFFILAVAKLWPGILGLDWHWYGILFVVFAIKPLLACFKKRSQTPPVQPI